MKNLDELGVQELSQKEMMEVEGGIWLALGLTAACLFLFSQNAY